ncbi:unnamed protein product [Durusdinium trenchii]|uniref:C2 domain-containing protein n=1 Tax=Durusdinium trenchii TaxID=1381693 RepID=A0ABP0QRA7_9DINO
MDYENSVKNWERYFGQHRQQNKILKDITQNATGVGAANQTIASNQSANTNSMGQTGDQRVTTRTVMKVINNFLFQFSTEKMDQTNKAGIIRLMPHELLKMSPADVDTSLVGTVSSWIAVLGERFATPPPPSVLRSAGVPAPRGAMPEPHLDAATWDTQVRKAAGESWGPYAQQIFANFCLPIEKRVSLHEFFLGLICCSKGTVSEKAMALFHLFGYIGPEPMVHHINPISHSTHIIIERNEGKSYQEESNFLKAPRDDEIKTMALHLQIYVYAFGASGMVEVVQGEVFVPTLVPFVTNALVGDNPRTFTIWGPEKQLPPGFSRENDPALLTDHGVRPYVGDMVLDLKWMPESPAKPEVGQLGIQLHSVSLNLDAPETKNPRVEVYTYTESGEKIQLKRWDPRTTMRKVSNALAMAPKVGKYVEWERTMRRNEVTGQLFKKLAAGDHGWNKEEKIWKWSTQWGAQYSVERTVFRKAVCEKAQVTVAGQSAQKPNLITLPACRVIVAGILNRSLHPVTHRQAILMADQIFSRCGAVPGILDALIIEGDVTSASESLTKAKEEFAELGRKWQDMKKYMVVAHELQVMMSSYGLDLFTPEVSRDSGGRPLNLQMLEIKDPFPGQSKTLWLRYCRAGDGQRYNSRIPVDPDGALRGGRVKLDYDYEADPEGANLQLQLNKQEFVNCFCSSSILHETLAQFSTSDNSTANVPDGIAINLDVTIADPTKEEADADLMDTLNVRQGVLLEVWDADMGKSDDFLGECWLPALGSLTAAPKRYVLPVTNAPPEKGATRYHSKKFSKVTCEGHLIVDASWTFPSETVPPLPDAADMEKRVKREEILHTGKLKLKIIKAEGLRGADRGFRREGSDPYVCMYVKNEAFFRQEKEKIPPGFDENGWHQTALGRHECYWTTSTKKATRNPEWNEEKEFMLRTGAFERRTKQAYHLELTSRQATRHRDDYYAAAREPRERLLNRLSRTPRGVRPPGGMEMINPSHAERLALMEMEMQRLKAAQSLPSLGVNSMALLNSTNQKEGQEGDEMGFFIAEGYRLQELHQDLLAAHQTLQKRHVELMRAHTELQEDFKKLKASSGQRARAKHPSLGVVRLDYDYPPAPGDTDCPGSFGYDVYYRCVPGLSFEMCQSGKFTEMVERRFADAIKHLEARGVSAITGDCGFMMAFQVLARKIAKKPIFMSSMVQCPIIGAALDPMDQVLILTANDVTLKPQKEVLLSSCGFDVDESRFIIQGCQGVPGFEAVAKGEKVPLEKVQAGILRLVRFILEERPAIRAILLECTELPPYADALRYHTGLPVWDAISCADFYVSAFQDNKRYGQADWQEDWDGEQEEYELGKNLTKDEAELVLFKSQKKKEQKQGLVAKKAKLDKVQRKVRKQQVSTFLGVISRSQIHRSSARSAASEAPILGVIRLDYDYPPAEGDIDCPGSYDYDVLFRVVPGFSFAMAQSGEMTPEVEQEFIEAVKWLNMRGVSGITGDCGFMMAFQPLASKHSSVPVFMSAMMQCPMISIAFDKYDKVLILTANEETLKPQKVTLLRQCGFNVDDRRFLIVGCQDVPGFDAVAKGKKVDVEYVTPGIVYMVKQILKKHASIRAICLECTELPPYADALRAETKLPVFDAITNADFFISARLDNPRFGFNQWQLDWDGQQEECPRVLGNKEELRMYFGPKDTKEKDGPGMNHNIQIYLGDNMHQFKDKLAAACKAEAAVEKNRKRQQQLEAVANDMSYRHSVMVFVPSQRLRELAQQGKVGVSSYEYKRLYRIEEQDPSSWQPLDSICTFMHYSNIYSFGRSVAQRLRVVDGTEQYRLKNNRLRQFEREQKKYQERLQDMNMPNKCFGYAKFQHPSDGNSLEWRPALINRSEQVGTSKKTFKVSYVYSSHIANGAPPEDALAPGPSFQEELDEEAILPAPSDPKIKDFLRSEHKEFLARAKILKEQGMADTEILRQLNEELKQSWAKSKEADDGSSAYPAQPPTMTLADVQEAIRSKADDETLSTFPPGSTMAPGSTMTTG